MSLLYSAFAIILSIALITNILVRRPADVRGIYSDSFAWSINGVPYLVMFVMLSYHNTAPNYIIYLFQIIASIGFIWLFRSLEFKERYVPKQVPMGIGLFVTAWTLMGGYIGMSTFAVLLPSVLVLSTVSLMMAAYFFIRSDKEIQLKTVIGILYGMLAIIKLMYIIQTYGQEAIFFIGLFVLDFMIYMFIAVLIFLNSYYRQLITRTNHGQLISDLLENSTEPIALLDSTGTIIFTNAYMKHEMEENGAILHSLQDIFDSYGPADQTDWGKKAAQAFEEGEGCICLLRKTSTPSVKQRYFTCDVIPNNESYNILFSIRAYPSHGFWEEGLSRPFDQLVGNQKKGQWIDVFDQYLGGGIREKVGLILVRLTNKASIESDFGKALYEDFIAAVMEDIRASKGINHITLFNEATIILLTEDTDLEHIQSIADELVRKSAKSYKISDLKISASTDLGIAVYPDDGNNFGALLRTAQMALARNTPGSAGRIQYYDPEFNYLDSDRTELEKQLRQAIADSDFDLLYQPQVDTTNGQIRGFEALIRWSREDGSAVSPNIFMPMAEAMGIIETIGSWALNEAVAKASDWQKEFGRKFVISINVSGYQLENPDFVNLISEILTQYDYDPHYLELDVTESKIIRTSSKVYPTLKAVKTLGVKIALDGFGSGNSSLDCLRWLPFDVLKIDRLFIDYLGADTIESKIVYSVIELVHKMNLETVAQGVENDEQLKALQKSSCTYGQGYLFSGPLSEFQARELLLEMD